MTFVGGVKSFRGTGSRDLLLGKTFDAGLPRSTPYGEANFTVAARAPDLKRTGNQMRLWSIHPKYLDSRGLVALWREALLAQNVLLGNTVGYRNHPQLKRFKESKNPKGAIASYLRGVEKEARARNYNFNKSKINAGRATKQIPVTSGQLEFECSHLKEKLRKRDMEKLKFLESADEIELHPLFKEVRGEVESWEIRRNR